MKFRKLRIKEVFWGLILIAAGYLFVRTDQFYIPERYRFYAFCIFIFLELTGYFMILKPEKPFRLSNSVSLIIGVVTLLIIVIQHIIIRFDITAKSLYIFITAVLAPYLVGTFYYLFLNKKEL